MRCEFIVYTIVYYEYVCGRIDTTSSLYLPRCDYCAYNIHIDCEFFFCYRLRVGMRDSRAFDCVVSSKTSAKHCAFDI